MIKQTLRSKYNSVKHKLPKYAIGGTLDPSLATKSNIGLSQALGAAGAIGSGIIDATGKGNTKVGGALSQGMSLASAGAAAGPWGALAGGVLGLGLGWINAGRMQKKQRAQDRLVNSQEEQASLDSGQAAIAADSSLVRGYRNSSYFANGGTLPNPSKPKRTTSSNYPPVPKDLDWSYVDITTPKGNVITDQNFRDYKAGGLEFSNIRELGNYIDRMTPVVSKPVTIKTGRENMVYENTGLHARQIGGHKFANGGSLVPMNGNAVEVKGASHSNGGVQLPGAEVEGGETISNGFVFSDKLGYSDKHKPIAKSIGKIEKKINSAAKQDSLKILQNREQALALSQEYRKQQMGIPSDLDNV